jgi:lipopolysaccharide cholinephosphotransferase
MNNINNAVTQWLARGGNPDAFNLTTGKISLSKKAYLSYDPKKGWGIIELNLFERIARVIGAFKNTRYSKIETALRNVKLSTPGDLSSTDTRIQEIFDKILSKFHVDTPHIDRQKIDPINQTNVQNVAPSYLNKDLKNTDAVLKRTSQDAVNKIYDSLEVLDNVLRENKIEYTICGGTQLGAIRHVGVDGNGPGGLIPWDDDGDIAILQKDLDKLISLKDEFENQGYELVEHEFCWKIQPKDGTPYSLDQENGKNNEIIKFPFIDIFVMDEVEEGKYHIANDEARKRWGYEYYSKEEWESITDVQFGHLKLRGLVGKHAEDYLDRGYSDKQTKIPNWKNVAARWWDHEEAQRDAVATPNWQNIRNLELIDRTHAVARPTVNLNEIAQGHLDEMTNEEMDNDWMLSEFFGHARILNLDINPARLERAKEHLARIGADEDFSTRFKGILGRTSLDPKLWDRVDSNYKHYDVNDPEQYALLVKQHAGQAGCYMSHYQIVKETREKYYGALSELEQARYNFNHNEEADQEDLQEALDAALKNVMKYSSVMIIEDDNGFGIVEQDGAQIASYGRKANQIKVTGHKLKMEGTGRILREAIRDLPEDWDMLYLLAMDYEGGEDIGKDHLMKLRQGVLNNCYVINAKFYDEFLRATQIIEEDSDEKFKAFDEQLANVHPTTKSYVVQPPIAFQGGGDSDINEMEANGTLWQCHI